jgi:hypothetical protein
MKTMEGPIAHEPFSPVLISYVLSQLRKSGLAKSPYISFLSPFLASLFPPSFLPFLLLFLIVYPPAVFAFTSFFFLVTEPETDVEE